MQVTSLAAAMAPYIALSVKIVVLIVLGIWGRHCLKQLTAALDIQPPGVETSWGGLGGSLGGWSMSKSLAWLLVTLLTMVLFAALALQLSDGLGGSGAKNDAHVPDTKQAPPPTK